MTLVDKQLPEIRFGISSSVVSPAQESEPLMLRKAESAIAERRAGREPHAAAGLALLAVLPWLMFVLVSCLFAFVYQDFAVLVWALNRREHTGRQICRTGRRRPYVARDPYGGVSWLGFRFPCRQLNRLYL